jgi:hypothetical protein
MFGPSMPIIDHNLQNMIAQHTMPFHTPTPQLPPMLPQIPTHHMMPSAMNFSLGPPSLPTITPDMHLDAVCHVDSLTNKLFDTPMAPSSVAPLVQPKTQGVIDRITDIITPNIGESTSLCHDNCNVEFAVNEAKSGANMVSRKGGKFSSQLSNIMLDKHCHNRCDQGRYPDSDKPPMTDREFSDAVSTRLHGKPLHPNK